MKQLDIISFKNYLTRLEIKKVDKIETDVPSSEIGPSTAYGPEAQKDLNPKFVSLLLNQDLTQ